MRSNTFVMDKKTVFFLAMAMLYTAISIAATCLAYKVLVIDVLVVSGASALFPFNYFIINIVTETYGYKASVIMIWFGLACELIFAILVTTFIAIKSPSSWHSQAAFNEVLGSSVRFVLSGIVADLSGNFFGAYIISKWKILWKGKHFWFRIIVTTILSDTIMVLLIMPLGFWGKVAQFMSVMIDGYILHCLYAISFALPSWYIAMLVKDKLCMDIYDYEENYNPFKILAKRHLENFKKQKKHGGEHDVPKIRVRTMGK